MKQKLNLIVSLAAGLAGSAIMHYVAPPLAFAQDQTQAPKEIRAQSFVLVDPSNRVVGTFTPEYPAAGSRIVLRDPGGRVIWTPQNGTKILPLTMK